MYALVHERLVIIATRELQSDPSKGDNDDKYDLNVYYKDTAMLTHKHQQGRL